MHSRSKSDIQKIMNNAKGSTFEPGDMTIPVKNGISILRKGNRLNKIG